MTDPAGTIDRATQTEPGAAYHALVADAIAMIQTLAGDVWTDYNYSDPGVTILEQLAYALTELPYRALLPVEDLLAGPDSARLALRRHAMYPAWSILPCNPVTLSDWRRLLIDRVPGLANIWLVPLGTTDDDPAPQGLYAIRVLAKREGGEEAALIERVRRCFVAHRGLAEDVERIDVLTPIDTVVEAAIEIAHDTDPDEALAQGLFALTLTLAPEPTRIGLADWRARHQETTAVFSGPLMLRGFIEDDQLKPAPTGFTVEFLAEVLGAAPGILAVDALTVRLDGQADAFAGAAPIPVPDGAFLHLWTRPLAHGRFSITITRMGARIVPDAARVERKLEGLWTVHRKTWALRGDYIAAYPGPIGDHVDLAAYTSVQTQFPLIYGIGENALADGVGAARSGAAKQLKGYLMAFDQLLADYFAQLALLRTLVSIEAGGPSGPTYAWQSLRPIVPDVAPLISRNYELHMAELVGKTDPVERRRGEVLDLLMGMLGLDWVMPLSTASPTNLHARDHTWAQIAAQQAMLRRAVPATRDRGRGLDYLRHRHRAVAGTEWASRIELGLIDREHEVGEVWPFAQGAPDAIIDFRYPPHLWEPAEVLFVLVTAEDLAIEGGAQDADDLSFLAGRRIVPELLLVTHHADAYRIGYRDDLGKHSLACRDPDGQWWLVARVDRMETALRLLRALRLAADRQWRDRLHLVDWILLRHGAGVNGDAGRFGMHVTAVLPMHPLPEPGDGDAAWEMRATTVLRANTPAHIALDCLFLGRAAMAEFELLYAAWRLALGCRGQSRLARASRRLDRFLAKHLPPVAKHDPDPPPAPPPPPDPAPPPAPPPQNALPVPVTLAIPDRTDPDEIPTDAPAEMSLLQRLEGLAQRLISPVLRLIGSLRPGLQPGAAPTALLAAPQPAAPKPVQPSHPARHAVAAPPGARGFDCDSVLAVSGRAAAFKAQGFTFAVRYLARETPGVDDLSAAEATAILDAGLALMAVQHVTPGVWHPTPPLGNAYGASAVRQARACGLPQGVCLWLDLESVARGTAQTDIVGYCNAWFAAVRAGGFRPALYVGADCGLDANALGTALDCEFFWRSGSQVPDVAVHGYCMVQTIDKRFVLDTIAYDLNVIEPDARGATPFWAVAGTTP
ncbi:DUF1906 domain-containing protein [Novosphingobium sp. FSW06-99]|uniref:DUF1906 domain-containing protein n=1 Tax=Novosphingobium sp. FSW06-99 TaxID=1739113 RepID=UPI00076BD50F|nr:DUF1906 domain-containing protein [Novosphingobium sp. FSW06-99]KUR72073.1 hypothetical protein AQZ49_20515 [Novosphingobium sp. FSW06-99]